MYENYSISAWSNGDSIRVRLPEIVAEFDGLGKPVPAYLTRLRSEGCRYS